MIISNFKDKLDILMRQRGVKAKELAAGLGCSYRHLQGVKNGTFSMSDSMYIKICSFFNVPTEFFAKDENFIPPEKGAPTILPANWAEFAAVQMGQDGEDCFNLALINLRYLKTRGIDTGNLFFVHVLGSEMLPDIQDHADVLVNGAMTEPVSGRIFYVQYNGRKMMRRIELKAGKITLKSSVGDIPVGQDDEFKILGLVVLQINEL